ACSTDPTLECSSSAIMTASITHGLNAALQQWDINAVRAVYPGSTPPPPPPPSGSPYDKDLKADEAVWRPSEGNWYVKRSSGGTSVVQWGISGDQPMAADYDGDGTTDLCVWRRGTWYVRLSSGSSTTVAWGITGDTPLKGDFDGD